MTASTRLRTLLFLLPIVAASVVGCGSERVEDEKPIALGEIPAPVLKVAREQLPGVEFSQAWVGTVDGRPAYEIRGTNDRGKVRELKITDEGKVLEIE